MILHLLVFAVLFVEALAGVAIVYFVTGWLVTRFFAAIDGRRG